MSEHVRCCPEATMPSEATDELIGVRVRHRAACCRALVTDEQESALLLAEDSEPLVLIVTVIVDESSCHREVTRSIGLGESQVHVVGSTYDVKVWPLHNTPDGSGVRQEVNILGVKS